MWPFAILFRHPGSSGKRAVKGVCVCCNRSLSFSEITLLYRPMHCCTRSFGWDYGVDVCVAGFSWNSSWSAIKIVSKTPEIRVICDVFKYVVYICNEWSRPQSRPELKTVNEYTQQQKPAIFQPPKASPFRFPIIIMYSSVVTVVPKTSSWSV